MEVFKLFDLLAYCIKILFLADRSGKNRGSREIVKKDLNERMQLIQTNFTPDNTILIW